MQYMLIRCNQMVTNYKRVIYITDTKNVYSLHLVLLWYICELHD